MLYTFRTIAKYERKILMRSWFFRIFAGLALFVLFIFNMAEVSDVGDMEWIYRAVPANMPYLNLFILNVAQAIIAVFLASEFIKRDRKQDTAEVFFVRSMSNATYILGKTWSIVSIFLLINAAALTLGLVFNLLASDTKVAWQAYLFYPLLISLPTLLYIIGLSCVLMSIIRNQALTFVVLVGYIIASLIFLPNQYHYLFDYMAFHLPLFHSDIVGFADLRTILTLRGMYAALGLGLICFSILFLRRLSQSRIANFLAAVGGISFLSIGGYLGYLHLQEVQRKEQLPLQMIQLNEAFIDHPQMDVESHYLTFEQEVNGFSARSRISGTAPANSSSLVFKLNPSLIVQEVLLNQSPVDYERKVHLLFVELPEKSLPDSVFRLSIQYEGTIDEAACYLDIDRETKYKRPRNVLFDYGRHYAFNTPDYALLTPETSWYPMPGVGYSPSDPSWFKKDFVDYQLTVKTLPGLSPVSPGVRNQIDSNTYVFETGFNMPHLPLAIGRYEHTSMQADSMAFSLYYISGHDYFRSGLPDIRDTIPYLIKERLEDFERESDLRYPFEDFTLVEVPGQFKSYDRAWTSLHETNHCGMAYFPEKGMHNNRWDFNGSFNKRKRWGRNRDRSPEEIQMDVLYGFLDDFFRFKNVRTNNNGNRTTVEETINPFCQFAQLYELRNNLESDEWPVLNRVFESYFKTGTEDTRWWVRRSSGTTQYEQANMVLQEKSFADILTLKENQDLIDNVIELKGELLFSMMQAKAGDQRFRDFINQILEDYRFQNLAFDTFNELLRAQYNIDLSDHMSKWFREIEMPRYLFNDPVAEKVLAGDREMIRVRFKVSNLGTSEGVLKASLRLEEPSEKLLFLEAGETKEVHYLSVEPPSGILFNTLVSGNLPNQISYNFNQIPETNVTNARAYEISVDAPVQLAETSEIIIDNESPNFAFSEYQELSRLRKWLNTEEDDDFKYKGTIVWRPPFNWTATTDDDFFGDFIRSAYYIKAGDGTKQAIWKVKLPEPGHYDVFYHVYLDESFNWSRNQKGSYQFEIPHDNGTDRPTIELSKQTPTGWTLLGDYSFSSDSATIILNNESKLRAVFADAVKLVKMD